MSRSKKTLKKEAADLREQVRHHDHCYYVKDDPQISDAEYDELKERLRRLEQEHPDLRTPDSPTQRVGGEALDQLENRRHATPMLSLKAVYEADEVEKFRRDMRKSVQGKPVLFAEPKFDGLSLELIYENGALQQALTRGDGETGEVVTPQAKTVKDLPLKLNDIDAPQPKELTVRGEILMYRKDFDALNKQQDEAGKKRFANPRNAAAGSLRQLDPKKTAARRLHFVVWQLVHQSGKPPATHSACMERLAALGFRVSEPHRMCRGKEDDAAWHDELAEQRDKLPFEIDGCVYKLNRLRDQERLGARSAHPRWAVAWKFEPQRRSTTVRAIHAQVGRTGAVTPVADLEPVGIGGTTVTHVTLHNQDEVERLDVAEGDRVLVERAGDVIPHLVRVMKRKGSHRKIYRLPNKCPVCGSSLVRPEGEAVTRCENNGCPARRRELLLHFCSRGALDIDGFGEKLVGQLVDRDRVKTPADLFDLDADTLCRLEHVGRKQADKLIKARDEAKQAVTLPRLIYALGIPTVGRTVAVQLAGQFHSLEKLMEADRKELRKLEGVGPVLADTIAGWAATRANREEVERLRSLGLDPRFKTKKGALSGKKVVLTGTLESMTRDEAKDAVAAVGGHATSSVSGDTDLLVKGRNPGRTKMEDAKKHQVKVIQEKAFLKRIGRDGRRE